MQDITIAIARYWKFFVLTTKRTPKSNLGHFQPTAITFESVKGQKVQKYRIFNQKIIFQTNHCPLLEDFVSNYKASSNNQSEQLRADRYHFWVGQKARWV